MSRCWKLGFQWLNGDRIDGFSSFTYLLEKVLKKNAMAKGDLFMDLLGCSRKLGSMVSKWLITYS